MSVGEHEKQAFYLYASAKAQQGCQIPGWRANSSKDKFFSSRISRIVSPGGGCDHLGSNRSRFSVMIASNEWITRKARKRVLKRFRQETAHYLMTGL